METDILACPKCGWVFQRRFELERHIPIHDPFESRKFGCSEPGCGFRSNQKNGLRTHVRSAHEKIRIPCDVPGCLQTFPDPSSRTRHRKKVHNLGGRRKRQQGYANITTTPSSAHEMRPPVSHAASSGPSTSVDRPVQPPGVPPDCWPIDVNIQTKHQAYNANLQATPTAWGYYRDGPVPSGSHSSQPGRNGLTETLHDESCHCWDCRCGSLTLAPIQGPREEEEMGAQRPEAPVAFSYPRMGHVHPSDQRWRLRPMPTNAPSPAYSRPYPRLLFGDPTPGPFLSR